MRHGEVVAHLRKAAMIKQCDDHTYLVLMGGFTRLYLTRRMSGGNFRVLQKDLRGGRSLRIRTKETDTCHVKRSRDAALNAV